MIILLGFRQSNSPEDDDTQYQITDQEAWKVISVVEPGESRRKNPVVYVTIYSEDLTGENCNDNIEATRRELSERAASLDLFP